MSSLKSNNVNKNMDVEINTAEIKTKYKEGLIHLIPPQPSLPKSLSQTWGIPNPTVSENIFVVANAEEKIPKAAGPICLARIVSIRNVLPLLINDPIESNDSDFIAFLGPIINNYWLLKRLKPEIGL